MIVSSELCYICGEISDFVIEDNASLLREAKCNNCTASIRNSDTARMITKASIGRDLPLSQSIDLLKKSNVSILESQASGPIHSILKQLPNYTSFEYFDGIDSGEVYNGILCNNFEQLAFEDNSFDIIISQDVLEHIEYPERALSEINRVLKLNGHHVFTIPLHEADKTKSRKNLRPVYHGDPIRMTGALVYTDWGNDITEIIDKYGMQTQKYNLHKFYESDKITDVDQNYSEYLNLDPLNYYRYNSVVFSSQKKSNIHHSTKLINELRLLEFGPDNIVEGTVFNEQPSGESALWVRTENAKKSSTILKIDDVALVSNCNDEGNLVTAIVPAWLYKFHGEYKIYLYDTVLKKRSNSLPFIVKKSSSNESINHLQQEYLKLAKELHGLKISNKNPEFIGWGMTSEHQVPWVDNINWATFRKTSDEIKKCFNFGLKEDIGIHAGNIDTLLWRHWVVAFSLQYAITFKGLSQENMNLIECGVGDGMSAFFALKEMQHYITNNPNIQYKMHLFDSWDSLRNENLTEKEIFIEGRYENNSLDRVKENLRDFESTLIYHVGYIPFTLTETISNISYLHIDLNSANSTLATLEYFYPYLSEGSVILFDDYGWSGFSETKEIIDQFFSNKPGILLKLPTGQAVYFYK